MTRTTAVRFGMQRGAQTLATRARARVAARWCSRCVARRRNVDAAAHAWERTRAR